VSLNSPFAADFNGLASAQPTLPLSWYYDHGQYAREMDLIWARNWVYLCRAEELSREGDYRVFTVAGREIIVVRDQESELVGHFNSCRHRGSTLCLDHQGRFEGGRITCPYHSWSYDLRGRLIATGRARPVEGFAREEFTLGRVAIAQWGGFVFANLAGTEAKPLTEALGEEFAPLANWPLEHLQVGHRFSTVLKCNWKLFWENFNECLHCPKVHPDLCRLVPIYSRGLMVRKDDPSWRDHAGDDSPRRSGRLRDGAQTWSEDGLAVGPPFPGLTGEELDIGHTYAVALPSLFVVGHVDYVRSVQITPVDSETMEINAEWLFSPEVLAAEEFDPAAVASFAEQVMREDGEICEVNQRGIRSASAPHGVLMQEEYEVFAFQEWVRQALGDPLLAASRGSRAGRRKERG